MKTLSRWVFAVLFGCALNAQDTKALPPLPTTVNLTSGATLKNVSVLRWTSDGVVLKHAGGADPVRFVYIAMPEREVLQAWAAAQAAAGPTNLAPIAEKASQITVTGEMFAKGFDQPYIFAGVSVALYQRNDAENALKLRTALPVAISESRTNAKGEFQIMAPEGNYLLVARAERRYRGNDSRAIYHWVVPVSESSRVQLDSTNATVVPDITEIRHR